jgi:hypothetical protein
MQADNKEKSEALPLRNSASLTSFIPLRPRKDKP